jgi:DDE superfamily endonuclease
LCLLTGLIKAMRFSVGTVHDFQMYKDKGIEISGGIKILADSGFQGIQKEHKNSVIPHKKSKTKPLTAEQKAANKKQASKRVVIEHINRDCKIFRICGNKYRGKHKNYETNWQLIGAIVNLKKSTKNLDYATI